MQPVRRGEDHPVDAAGGDHFLKREVTGHAVRPGRGLAGFGGIDDAGQGRRGRLVDRLDVADADQTGADDGELRALGHYPAAPAREQIRRTPAT